MNPRHWLVAAASAALLALSACATAPQPPATVADATAAKPELSTLSRLVHESGLAETLRSAGPYTLFAPTDEAFKAVPAKTMAALASDKDYLKAVLGYHVLPSRLRSAEVTNSAAKTLQGAPIALSRSGTFVTVEDAVVMQPDVVAANGVVHVIDRVLLPPVK